MPIAAGAAEAAATTAESLANCARLQRLKPGGLGRAPRLHDQRSRQSAKADFVWLLQRIHSPAPRERLKPPQQRRKASQTARGFNGIHPDTRKPRVERGFVASRSAGAAQPQQEPLQQQLSPQVPPQQQSSQQQSVWLLYMIA
jgi:hypothetical protein